MPGGASAERRVDADPLAFFPQTAGPGLPPCRRASGFPTPLPAVLRRQRRPWRGRGSEVVAGDRRSQPFMVLEQVAGLLFKVGVGLPTSSEVDGGDGLPRYWAQPSVVPVGPLDQSGPHRGPLLFRPLPQRPKILARVGQGRPGSRCRRGPSAGIPSSSRTSLKIRSVRFL